MPEHPFDNSAIKISIQSEDFDIYHEIDRLKSYGDIGAVVSFTGLCRDENSRLSILELEHYPGMAEQQIHNICQTAYQKFDLIGMTVIHRYGKINPGDNIVLVITASTHRKAAFKGADFIMDFLKTEAPFWKKEHFKNNTRGRWVMARDKDEQATKNWLLKDLGD